MGRKLATHQVSELVQFKTLVLPDHSALTLTLFVTCEWRAALAPRSGVGHCLVQDRTIVESKADLQGSSSDIIVQKRRGDKHLRGSVQRKPKAIRGLETKVDAGGFVLGDGDI